jgi:hypothetical protein
MEEQTFVTQLHVCCDLSLVLRRQYSSVLGAAVASGGLLLHAWLQAVMQSVSLMFKNFLDVDHQSECTCNCRTELKCDTC